MSDRPPAKLGRLNSKQMQDKHEWELKVHKFYKKIHKVSTLLYGEMRSQDSDSGGGRMSVREVEKKRLKKMV